MQLGHFTIVRLLVGCCLYEALTGHKVFEGETRTDRIAAVLSRDPDWETRSLAR